MLNVLVGQFLGSPAGSDVLGQLKSKGLDGPAAQAAVTATAEGAMQQLGLHGGGTTVVTGLLGGAGGLGALTGGLLSGGAAPAASGVGTVGAMAAPVAHFVAQKTGLSPSVATMVVNLALPRLMQLIQSHGATTALPPAGAAMPGGVERRM